MTELEIVLRQMKSISQEDVDRLVAADPMKYGIIPNQDQEVEYDDKTHTYFLAGRIYRSATGIVSQFYEQFDTDEKVKWMVYRWGKTEQYWRDLWINENTTSLNRGNGIHDKQEQFLYDVGYTRVTGDRIHPVFRTRGCSVPQGTKVRSQRIRDLADGCYPELKLWDHNWAIAGRADKPTLETISGVRYAHVEDYKTNKELARNGYVDQYGNEKMMLYPLEHLPDCEMSHYTLQLSLYQFMLEGFGFKPGIRRIIHFPHEIEGLGTPSPKPYELPYLRDEVISMLEILNSRGWLSPARSTVI